MSRIIWLLASLLSLCTLPACRVFEPFTPVRSKEKDHQDERKEETKFRAPAEKSEPYFFDDRARQIEKNLGI